VPAVPYRRGVRALPAVAAAVALVATACGAMPPAPPAPSGPLPVSRASAAPVPTIASPAPTPSARPASTRPAPTRAPTRPHAPTASPTAPSVLAGLPLAARVGQLLMVGVPAGGTGGAALRQLGRYRVGGVILTGRSRGGVAATAALTARIRAAVPGSPVLIATDQEGGAVQVLKGPGFSTMPSARSQGALGSAELRERARTWGGQLRAAGVRADLAPVADTVPAGAANPPIGDFDRQYGSDPATVAAHATAFAAGLADAGVVPTAKHFPGLGRVTENTDVSSGVTDRVTIRADPYLGPFRAVIGTDHPFVMISSAVYRTIDPAQPAAFSSTVVTGMLRHDFGFDGVVISDDLGAARQVSAVPVGDRAVRFVAAGGDLVLTVSPATLPAMFAALYDRAGRDPAFRAAVDRSARRILLAKQRLGLVARGG
jgi:beta-N-acetylhexosaminidase